MDEPNATLVSLKLCAAKMGEMVVQELTDALPLATPAAARTFADGLMLCPNDDSARALMRQNPAGAKAFVQFLYAALEVAPTSELLDSIQTPQPGLPFHAVCAVVIEVADMWPQVFPEDA